MVHIIEPVSREQCDHYWISHHEPNHILYWVKICSACHEPDWEDLDGQINIQIQEAIVRSRFIRKGPYYESRPLAQTVCYECVDCDWKMLTVPSTDPTPEDQVILSTHYSTHTPARV